MMDIENENATINSDDNIPIDLSGPTIDNESTLDLSTKSSSKDSSSKNPQNEIESNENLVLSKKILVPDADVTKIDEPKSKSYEKEKSTSNEQKDNEYSKNVTYNKDGEAIYTDPDSKLKYKWSKAENTWTLDDDSKPNPYENEHYIWCSKTNQWILKSEIKDGNNKSEDLSNKQPKADSPKSQNQILENEFYKWNGEKWIPKDGALLKNKSEGLEGVTYGYEDGTHIYTDKDGMIFFWDIARNAWFPKVDDDFMARYQMSYGFSDSTTTEASNTEEKVVEKVVTDNQNLAEKPEHGAKRKAQTEPPKWFDIPQEQNTKVYVSNLPDTITEEEFIEIMSKCGMIMKDPQTQKYKVKLYQDKNKMLKGDGLCDYIKVESVVLALEILDGYVVQGKKIKVQRAQFEMRGEYNPSLKPKKKKKDKEKLLKMKEKLFDWRPEKMRGERSKYERTVILKNLFEPETFEKEVALILEYQNDLREECSKCGTVKKVIIYDRHSDGVAQVSMSNPDEADLVVQMMRGRYFGQRRLTAEIWDGKTKYKVDETEAETQKRITNWDKYLETEQNSGLHEIKTQTNKDVREEDKNTEASCDEESLPKNEKKLSDSLSDDDDDELDKYVREEDKNTEASCDVESLPKNEKKLSDSLSDDDDDELDNAPKLDTLENLKTFEENSAITTEEVIHHDDKIEK